MASVSLDNITKRFGDLVAVDDVSMTVKDGELLCLLGPSGCGKSTTLRTIGGFETPTGGSVRLNETDVTDEPPYRRNTSMVFQNWALFPYKTVLENVTFGLKMDGVDATEQRERAREVLEAVEMSGYEDQKPGELSGGQQQRVALARSLVIDPEVLLLDEPLSNLDKRLREQMQLELKSIHEEFDTTFVHVTHDQDEAFTIADRIGIMNDGKLVQIGDPKEVYNNPKNEFIEEFLGDTNFVDASVREATGNEIIADTSFGVQTAISVSDSPRVEPGDDLSISVRPEILTIQRGSATKQTRTNGGMPTAEEKVNSDVTNSVEGRIEDVLYRGSVIRYAVSVSETSVFVERGSADFADVSRGDTVTIEWQPDRLLAFKNGKRVGRE
jgi:spermidine/putrescine transport system ATP-binding protein